MRIAIFGATGKTGARVIDLALSNGHEVVALVRDPSKVTKTHPQLTVLAGSPVSRTDVERCVKGADSVIHCLGIGGKGDGKPTSLVSDSVKCVISVMSQYGLKRLICMSNVGAGGSGPWFARRVVVPLFLRWLMPILEDKDRMEQALRASSLDWVSVRLPMIIDGPSKPIRNSVDGRALGLSITVDSAAQFLFDQLGATTFLRQTPSVSN